MTFKEWEKENFGYDVITTYFEDFTIAEHFGTKAIKDTYARAKEEYKNNYKVLTELSLILNHKLWFEYNKGNMKLAKVYDELWRKHHSHCINHLEGEELSYYLTVTD